MNDLLKLVEDHRYEDLFLDNLFWDEGIRRQPVTVNVQGDRGQIEAFEVENVAGYEGIGVFVCPSLPSKSVQASIATRIGQMATNYLLIFHDGGAHQVWRWPAQVLRAGKSSIKLTSHEHTRGLSNKKLEKRLEAIVIPQGEDLDVTALLDKIQSAFETETEDETKKASQQMVDLFTALQKAGMSESHISETLARLLFVMFGDDTAMWGEGRNNLFERYILDHTAEDGSDIAEKLHELFVFLDTKPSKQGALAAEGKAEFAGFKYVNGGIFSNPQPLPKEVGQDFRDTILRASRRDWADISPAIFGSMFQSVRDAKTRREMGEHYTSEKNILKTLNPLFLDSLRDAFHSARGKDSEITNLKDLRKRLARIKFMDPACGCGNFVIIAYRELRALETAIVARLIELGAIDAVEAGFVVEVESTKSDTVRARNIDPMVSIDNFYGIEIDPWPAAIARTAMFLIERQSDQLMAEKFGYAPVRLPIRQESHIATADALSVDWKDVFPVNSNDEFYIAGNPPFLGHKEKSKNIVMKQNMQKIWGTKRLGHLDAVTCWFLLAKRFVFGGRGEFAFVATSSISKGETVSLLFDELLNDGLRIKFGYRRFTWDSDAGVDCVIYGFTYKRGKSELYFSDTKVVQDKLSPYLIEGDFVGLVSPRPKGKVLSGEVLNLSSGCTPLDGNNLQIDQKTYEYLVSDVPEALPYLRDYWGTDEFVDNKFRKCIWVEDYELEDALRVEFIRDRLEKVRIFRESSSRPQTKAKAKTPNRFGEDRWARKNFLAVPQTFSENRRYMTVAYLSSNVINSAKLMSIIEDDGFNFSLLSSSMMLAWQDAIGGTRQSRYSFTIDVVWNTLPLPPVNNELRLKIIEAGEGVLKAREQINDEAGETVSLATMYKPDSMPRPLILAHQELDKLVDVAFGAPAPLETNEERLQILFKQYDAMIKAEEKAAKAKRPGRKTAARNS